MKIIKINHIAITSNNSKECLYFFQKLLNLNYLGKEVIEDQKVTCDFFDINDIKLELLSPLNSDSTIQKYLDKKGSGIHHLALQVDSIQEWIVFLREKSIKLIHDEPQIGAHNSKIIFIHPKATGGILIELVEE